ncbi:MAG: EAL domain-containing response regulator [Proteobacteria bacterium]|nr:EAL domain-containing response regulator [Pseudomonadota bacterium]
MSVSSGTRPIAIVVDDEPEIRKVIGLAVAEAGFDVLEARDGLGALEILDRVVAAVIILDLQMSDGDGIQAIRGLAQRGTGADIFLCSGADMRILESTRDIALRQGLKISALLQKPVRRADLIERLRTLALRRAPFSADTLRRCIDKGLVGVHFQPKLSLTSLQIVGFEALLRCQDEIGRSISAAEVVELAETSGMIDEITETVFRQALRQCRSWRESGAEFGLAVNLSPRCSFDRHLPDLLGELCADAQVPVGAVTIELIETAVMNDEILGMEALIRLRLKGFRLSIDDFGIGYSSLIRLKQLPFSEIKVDKSFVNNLAESRDNMVIVASIIHLAQDMGLHCVIEGVESEDSLAFAAMHGCDEAQGYFIAKPMPAQDIQGFLKTWRWRQESLRSVTGKRVVYPPEQDGRSDGIA